MKSDYDKMDVMIGNENSNPIETEFAITIEGSTNHYETESNSHPMGYSSQENEQRDFDHENAIPRRERFLRSLETFTKEINLRLCQEFDSMMSMMHSQITRAMGSAIAGRVIPEIQTLVSSLSSGNRDTESGSSSKIQENSD